MDSSINRLSLKKHFNSDDCQYLKAKMAASPSGAKAKEIVVSKQLQP